MLLRQAHAVEEDEDGEAEDGKTLDDRVEDAGERRVDREEDEEDGDRLEEWYQLRPNTLQLRKKTAEVKRGHDTHPCRKTSVHVCPSARSIQPSVCPSVCLSVCL